ncbi:receptor-type guanylate cyclase Gyc76C isoform X1 [Drosophila sechellia]|uniref:receptor-type guanylate cyclase Gyc76C isoform X1 n=2 Tax=Drosophila sechellia TaxID=7238 RepID=UPI0013DDD268|nr:receptor-type guanylate cyclase Gyc76C isoform X1 [Drosophila sechellia]XP_032575540.1 receptor-type guanylate cyclase Gyc76C isoform X1 [Drosophila sechellia]XP_032575541.1 receptor-type guanylate cyclase Gyc76C isoform X1 [Drosophila sechellia]XP_032575542.1 receptor-type guanylate cyclase Gyc76C isoform X1 [Drosophila sechellia]XP_032575543.1 receptor-type guanylate cyclase Gyc76C isoform X1 [Drosophila sechellia]
MTRWPFNLLLLLSVAVRDCSNHRTVLTVGYLTALTGDLKTRQGLAISGALTMALDEVNKDPNLLPNVYLDLRWNDTKGDTVLATKAITEMICDGIATIFGPEGPCYVEAIVSQSRNIPMISYKCAEYRASAIPTFARTEPPDTQVVKSLLALLRYYAWNKFSILYEDVWSPVADLLKDQATKRNMTINHKQSFIDNRVKCCEQMLDCCRSGYWYQLVQNTMNRTRIYVFLGAANSLVDFMSSMETAGLFARGEYMVIFVDMMVYSEREAEKYLRRVDQITFMSNCHSTENFNQMARSLLVVASTPPTKDYIQFTKQVQKYSSKPPFNLEIPRLFVESNFSKFISIYAAYLYDSVKLYAWAVDKMLREETRVLTDDVIFEVASNGTRVIDTIIKNRTYMSITGSKIKIDQYGDSEGNFSVLAYKPHKWNNSNNMPCNYHMVPVAYFHQGEEHPEYKLINGSIDWPSGGEKPADEPMCGFADELCKKVDTHYTSTVAAVVLGVLLFCSGVITMSIYRKWKIELEIEGLLWKIDPNEIKGYSGNEIVSSPSKVSLMSAQSYGSRWTNQFVTSTGRLRGAVVRIKELKFPRKRDISREIMKEMRLLRELRHDNINSFIGASVEPTRILLVTDYCAKGSLYDIIENEDIKLDDLFIASLIHDLIKGMIYIHNSQLVYHGNLKSSNCVVTSRWMLQVTDFGLHELRQCAENESIGEHQHYRNQLWRAPELLRNHVHGSQKGDVYAFAIIMYEIFSRKGPFGQINFEPKEIVDYVKKLPLKGEDPFRPEVESIIEAESCPDYVLACIRDCWAEDPEERPEFSVIRNRLKKMRGGKTKNIMDQMMEMMEKYANNLEDIVTERTRLLCEEKMKTEDLLHRMLPQSVAEKLTMGQGVEPVSYDLVTIYFSDIVGFTAMSAESTPLQVVNFLNDLYTVFDRIIRGYDVYKVETIGDAYMVVSGLPIKNGDRHAGEIASMALELLHAVKQHRIAHRPNETLKLRIGMHTGPVVAGVVGLTMPRYCLFGDTVNTASRMESNGEALKIHISNKCKLALDKLGGGYITEERGLVNMKGKGEVVTWWLTGANENAIQKKLVDMMDMPPLFSRPRKSPKLNPDSRQPSIQAMHFCGNGSRRQSTVPRAMDGESTYSLQGSVRESPRMVSKRDRDRERPPINGLGAGHFVGGALLESAQASLSTLNHSETNETNCDMDGGSGGVSGSGSGLVRQPNALHKPLAMVRPHRIISAAQLPQLRDNDDDSADTLLRESRSLDPMPMQQLRKRHDRVKLPPSKLSKNNSRSLDTGVSLISGNPNGEVHSSQLDLDDEMTANPVDATDGYDDELGLLMRHDNGQLPALRYSGSFPNAQVSIVPTGRSAGGGGGREGGGSNCAKHLNNNCNGGVNIEDDLESPLLQRQASLSVPPEEMLAHNKRWHSLEHMDGPGGHGGNSVSYAADIDNRHPGDLDFFSGSSNQHHRSKAPGGSKLTNWMTNIFKGNGVRSGEARRVGILPSSVHGARTGFTDMAASAAARDRESIV